MEAFQRNTTKFLAIVIFFIYNSEASSTTLFKTHEGCNASFVCYHPFGASVNWNSSHGPLEEGPKVVLQNTSFYSVLNLISVSPADNGNITCQRNQSETLYFSIIVQQAVVECKDIFNTVTCKGAVDGGDDCTHIWMRDNCKKSCGLCPTPASPAEYCTKSEQPTEYNHTESLQPKTDPPTRTSTTRNSSEFSTASTTEANNNTAAYSPSNNFVVAVLANFVATLILT